MDCLCDQYFSFFLFNSVNSNLMEFELRLKKKDFKNYLLVKGKNIL